MYKLALVRDSRISALDHYKFLKNFDINFISGNSNPHIAERYKLPNNVRITNLKLINPLGIDPISLLGSNATNLAWNYFADLEQELRGSDLIGISDNYYFWNYQTIKFAKKNNIPVFTILWCNIPNHISTWLPPYAQITREVIDYTSLFILRNNKALELTDSLKIPRSKVKVIYKGIDLTRFKPRATTYTNPLNILYVGRLEKSKGVTDIIAAFSLLHRKYPDTTLTVAGRGSLTQTVITAAETLPINLLGFVEYYRLPEIYQQADIFCSPSKTSYLLNIPITTEYFSYTLMEAQAAGLPIVATEMGGIPEEVDPRNFLVEEGNIGQIYAALEKLVVNHELRKTLGKINRQRALAIFDTQKQAHETEQALLNLLNA